MAALIREMIQHDPKKRPSLEKVKQQLQSGKQFSFEISSVNEQKYKN